MNKFQEEMLNAALRYADNGWAVLPVAHSKKPINHNGSRGATTDKMQISKWWSEYPNAQIGIATGKISGIWVVDVDMKNGKDGVKSLKTRFPDTLDLPEDMPIQKTPTGGFHFVFKWDDSRPVKNGQEVLEGIDIRGDGGFIVVSPSSFSVDGEWIKYRWKDPDKKPISAPNWAWTLVESGNETQSAPVDLSGALTGIRQGNRDNDIFRIACMLNSRDVSFNTALTFIEILAERCVPKFDLIEAREKVKRAYTNYNKKSQESKDDMVEQMKKFRKDSQND